MGFRQKKWGEIPKRGRRGRQKKLTPPPQVKRHSRSCRRLRSKVNKKIKWGEIQKRGLDKKVGGDTKTGSARSAKKN